MSAHATIHRLPAHRRGGGHIPTGEDLVAEDTPKLDRAIDMLTDLRVQVARIAERQAADAEQRAAQAKDLEDLAAKHREDTRRLWAAVEDLGKRPPGWTGRQVWTVIGTAAGVAAALASIADKIIH